MDFSRSKNLSLSQIIAHPELGGSLNRNCQCTSKVKIVVWLHETSLLAVKSAVNTCTLANIIFNYTLQLASYYS